MDAKTLKRLEKAGWSHGDYGDFLGMTPEDVVDKFAFSNLRGGNNVARRQFSQFVLVVFPLAGFFV